MSRLKQAIKHAFAVDAPGAAEPTPPQRELVDRVCQETVRRHMTSPALLFLEMSRPLNYVGAQVLHFFHPIVSAVIDVRGYQQFASFLEQRGSIEYICLRLEHFEQERLEGAKRKRQADRGGQYCSDVADSDLDS